VRRAGGRDGDDEVVICSLLLLLLLLVYGDVSDGSAGLINLLTNMSQPPRSVASQPPRSTLQHR